MSSSLNNFPSALARALSPGVDAQNFASLSIHPGATADSVASKLKTARLLRLQGCQSVDDIIKSIPHNYQDALSDPLIQLSVTARKLHSRRATLVKLQQHLAKGTWPAHLRGTPPKVQLTAEYRQSAEAVADQQKIDAYFVDFQRKSLEQNIATVSAEVNSLDVQCAAASIYVRLSKLISARWGTVASTQQLPVVSINDDGSNEVTSWAVPDSVTLEYRGALEDCTAWGLLVCKLEEIKNRSVEAKLDKKKKLQAVVADMEVEGAAPSSSVQSLVDKAVAQRFKSIRTTKVKGKVCLSEFTHRGSNALLTAKRCQAEEQAARRPSQASSSSPYPQNQGEREVARQNSRREKTQQGETTSAPASMYITFIHRLALEENLSLYTGEKERQEATSKISQVIDHAMTHGVPEYRYGIHASIPDWLLTIPTPTAAEILLRTIPLDRLLVSQFRHYVHVSPGVKLPNEIAFQLAVGMKYMIYQPMNKKLISASWMDFQRRLRWRIKFSMEGNDSKKYDPEYDVRTKLPSKKTIILPQYLELGLIEGRKFVYSTISNIPDQSLTSQYQPLGPKLRLVKEFLIQHDYIVTGTDKNLGIAVSKRSWILEKCLDLLNDTTAYQPLTRSRAKAIMARKKMEMKEIAQLAHGIVRYTSTTLPDFFESQIPNEDRGESFVYPTFYGIPKIHKTPTKMRPIIPCHSAIMNPAAKFVSKNLKPLINAAPTVLHGTKDLAQKLSQLTLSPTARWYIVTGDVVAFYPNINLERCNNIIANMFIEYLWTSPVDKKDVFEDHQAIIDIFTRCLHTGSTELVCEFQGQLYLQLQGLAMGVASSPDQANLFAAHFEQLAHVTTDPKIPFYGRYIDDCLAIVYASSEQEAVDYMSKKIVIDTCTIEWNASWLSQPFLDMLLYRDDQNELHHMPYRKARNHQERIPWISHHPLDVKRGTCISEMSRLATLSSKQQSYKDALSAMIILYVARGYPRPLVLSWVKQYALERWNKRLETHVSREPENVLVLKTEYNTAWNYFNAAELGNRIFGYWREWLERADRGDFNERFPPPPVEDKSDLLCGIDSWANRPSDDPDTWSHPILDIRRSNILNRRLITSRKRTRNLMDITSLWKRTVLENLDELVLDDVNDVAPPNTSTASAGTSQTTLDTWDKSNPVGSLSNADSDDELQPARYRERSPGVPASWRSAPMGTWGQGSRTL